ncbi:MAG: NAD-dependent epimerase/dehydratase family protein [Sphingobacterium sp.]|nr:NAD-dependent epimerase/dehydratase family protein [Sphingobacterium sp.]
MSDTVANRKSSQVTVTVWGTGKPFREFMCSGDMADATVYT